MNFFFFVQFTFTCTLIHGCFLVLFCRFACTLISTSCIFLSVLFLCFPHCVNYCVISCFSLFRLFDRSLLVRHIFWFYCLYSVCLTQLMRCSWPSLGLRVFSCSLTAVNTQKKRLSIWGILLLQLCQGCIDFPQEYFVVIAVIAIFYIVQRKLFDTWFTARLCVFILWYFLYWTFFLFFFAVFNLNQGVY